MLDEMLASNVRGTFLPMKHELEFMRRRASDPGARQHTEGGTR